MAAQWYYQVMGQQLGPVSPSQLRTMAGAGAVAPDTMVKQGTDGAWVFARQVRGLFEEGGPLLVPPPGVCSLVGPLLVGDFFPEFEAAMEPRRRCDTT